MSTRKLFDPLLREILEKIALDPRSHLLRAPKLVVPSQREAPVRDREALLTRAERRLVAVHRFEVADLLLQEVRRAVSAHEEAKGQHMRYISADRVFETPGKTALKTRAQNSLSVVPQDIQTEDAASLLARCVRTTPGGRPSPVQLATASLRLVPRESTRICLGMALHQAGQTQSGLEVLWGVVRSKPSELMLSYAWQNIAHLEYDLDHTCKTLDALRAAALTRDRRGDPAMSWFKQALKVGDSAEMLRSAKLVEEALPVGHASIAYYIQMCTDPGRRHPGEISDESRRVFSKIEDRLPKQAWRIGHALSKTE